MWLCCSLDISRRHHGKNSTRDRNNLEGTWINSDYSCVVSVEKTNRLKRADHLQQLGVLLLENKEIQEVLHILIVGSTWYDAKTWSFVSDEMEQKVDRFFWHIIRMYAI